MTDAAVGATERTLRDPLDEALRLIGLADQRGLLVRLMGGLAFRAQAPDWIAGRRRVDCDIDFAIRNRDRKGLSELLAAEGYVADKQYNALFGHKQLYFLDQARKRPMDVLVDQFEMCHRFAFGDRLTVTTPTLPLAELLLSKLQVVKINRKDVLDALALLGEHPLAARDGSGAPAEATATISLDRIVTLTSNDWGWWRTITLNLDKLGRFLETDLQPGELEADRPLRFDPATQVADLSQAIEAAPKSTRWKLRSRIGERATWYAEPEEMGHDRA
jgi:hypothetical protein